LLFPRVLFAMQSLFNAHFDVVGFGWMHCSRKGFILVLLGSETYSIVEQRLLKLLDIICG